MNGKGSKPRPVDRERYERNWEKIFGKKVEKEDEVKKSEEKKG